MSLEGKSAKEKRARRRAAGLRKHQHLENVVVEETFTLASKEGGTGRGKVGDGVYVTATVASKRLYGVLVDQPALKEASALWLQDQADSLELNRRIKVLQQQQQLAASDSKDLGKNAVVGQLKAPVSSDPGKAHDQSSFDGLQKTVGDSGSVDTESLDAVNASEAGVGLKSLQPQERASEKGVSGETSKQSKPTVQDDMKGKNGYRSDVVADSGKRPLEDTSGSEQIGKRAREESSSEAGVAKCDANSKGKTSNGKRLQFVTNNDRPVQKFRYIVEKRKTSRRGETIEDPGYRVLVATFANVEEAACGNLQLAKAIEAACEDGGNCLSTDSTYYYQYEVLPNVLASNEQNGGEFDLRSSMGFHTFLQNTPLPPWFPLSNLHMRQGDMLNMLNMKKDNQGNISWDISPPDNVSSVEGTAASLAGGTKVTMQPRPTTRYQVGVVGGGIAGVACCQELASLLKQAGVDYHITLFEARPRLGGRLWTDRSYHSNDGESFPIELGASWIHGIDDNPLAALAKEAGIDFVTSSEEVQMLGKNMRRIDTKMDERSGKLFDDLLDHAADDCWSAPETVANVDRDKQSQAAVRWYSSVFMEDKKADLCGMALQPERIGPPAHRQSSDRSIDVEIGKAILKRKLGNFSKLSSDEHRMLMWNTKNIEYALGANIADLSMKYWDADDRHAFEGDHVLLKQGYSTVIDHMLKAIWSTAGNNFEMKLNFPVGQIEYARKSTTLPYGHDRFGRSGKMVELSDACSVSSQDGSQTEYFDFLVCACPLGVLKESIAQNGDNKETLSFQPPLPFSKTDAISNVGFGLLDKVYLTFPKAFWRKEGFFNDNDQCLFGNVTGVNPHHYMFFDIGRCLGSGSSAPPILMSLISGQEAVACEKLSDKELVDEVVATLRTIFSQDSVPEPYSIRFTRWGQDKYSRGSYTFLPPGATDQDFHLLQSPINGNGDSLLLEGSETMRLFFAGEHTTALHPSMAHGAMLSGMRAAKEVVATIQFKSDGDKDVDRIIPVALFRHKNPSTDLRCSLCHKTGGQIREGSLLAFKRGARQVLVHNNCAEFSPEVEVVDSKWKNVIRAVNRGRSLNCSLCKKSGATMGCTAENCYRVFHFSCSEDAGWRFERDGKVFYCDLHRKLSKDYEVNCDRISMEFYLSKNPALSSLFCRLCGAREGAENAGQLLAFQYGRRHALVHEHCIKYTSICDTAEDEDSRMGYEYKNVFTAIDESRQCAACFAGGATIRCTKVGCNQVYHFPCAERNNWKFEKRGKKFRCADHRKKYAVKSDASPAASSNATPFFNHNLLAQFGAKAADQSKVGVPGNLDMGGMNSIFNPETDAADESNDESESDESDADFQRCEAEEAMGLKLSATFEGPTRLVKVQRTTKYDPWAVSFSVIFREGKRYLGVMLSENGQSKGAGVNDIVVSIDGQPVGEGEIATLRDIVLTRLKDGTELSLELVHAPT